MNDSYYKHHVFFCTNQRASGRACCGNHNALELRNYMKAKIKDLGLNGKNGIRINTAGCMDRCAKGPTVVVYPEATWYRYESEQDLDEILESHLQNGRVVSRLQLED